MVVAHGGGGEEIVGAVLGLTVVVGGGLVMMVMQRRPGATRRAQLAVLAAAVVLVTAAMTLPSVVHQCSDWRDRVLLVTSGLLSASGSGSNTPPGLTAQDHADLQQRVSQVLDERPFGCV